MEVNKFFKENYIYIVLLIVAVIVAVTGYGTGSTIQTIAVFYCIIQAVVTLIDLNKFIIQRFFKGKKENSFSLRILLWFTIISTVYVAILNPYFQRFVLYAVLVTIAALFIYQIVIYTMRKIG